MVSRNPSLSRLSEKYLFLEIAKRKRAFLEKKPHVQLLDLGIGDTTQPLPNDVAKTLSDAALAMATKEGYRGYGPENGDLALRQALHSNPNEITISDGSKCSIARLQALFGSNVTIGVQDPCYPVFVEGSLIHGVENVVLFPCLPENNFFPTLNKHVDLFYICSPNNPTGAVYTHYQLKLLVEYAKEHKAIIIFDNAYSAFIQDPSLPKSIYEVEGADEVAIEVGSFSKMAGFTGLRLGWTIVPEKLTYSDGRPILPDWHRVNSTLFNGASTLIQQAGVAALYHSVPTTYMENARRLKEQFSHLTVYGGDHAPYLWVHFPGESSWNVFERLLEEEHIITTPGIGFGPSGESFIRMSSFGKIPVLEYFHK